MLGFLLLEGVAADARPKREKYGVITPKIPELWFPVSLEISMNALHFLDAGFRPAFQFLSEQVVFPMLVSARTWRSYCSAEAVPWDLRRPAASIPLVFSTKPRCCPMAKCPLPEAITVSARWRARISTTPPSTLGRRRAISPRRATAARPKTPAETI